MHGINVQNSFPGRLALFDHIFHLSNLEIENLMLASTALNIRTIIIIFSDIRNCSGSESRQGHCEFSLLPDPRIAGKPLDESCSAGNVISHGMGPMRAVMCT
ncbi:hypothetical protein PoB_002075600 [Plakobranchus ocellatus]|uniref:Uncharacterized protein n=1 Tax=Plakobranchus ocellatus TaxID=259542 RepID=A0AAV3Z4M7_9GAST|nr:hypothetical protein PoB_002075600 [Plakobranchus ocellatus]